jgi:transcription-repair coupling factor (superfamily II helicase)
MTLRPLLEIAAADERFRSLATAAREGRSVPVRVSAPIQPYLLAALVETPEGLGGRPVLVVAADDIGARDLARELRAYLAPRRVGYYPSRGTGYASHVAPPPHLVGLRIAALDAMSDSDPAVVVASAVALAEAVPDAALRPAGFTLDRGTEVDLGEVADRLVKAGYEHVDQVEERGQFAVRDPRCLRSHRGPGGAAGAVRRRDRTSSLVLDLHPALPGRGRPSRALARRRTGLGAQRACGVGPRG